MTSHPAPARRAPGSALGRAALVLAITVSAAVTCWLLGGVAAALSGDRAAQWVIGRASGITAYLLLVVLVATGLVLSHPWRTRMRWLAAATRIRIHVTLAVFTFMFVILHVVVLATDSYAGVGIAGALLPMGSAYRPVAVTLGVLGLYSGMAAGITAAGGGRLAARIWWPMHKVAAVSLALVWAHGLLAGTDTGLIAMYVLTGLGVIALAASRYASRNSRERAAVLVRGAEEA